MRLFVLGALVALASAVNNEDISKATSFCPSSYKDLEWPFAKPGIVCRCVPAQNSDKDFSGCTDYHNSGDCEGAYDGQAGANCAWSVYDWSGDTLANSKPENVDQGEGWVNSDGTITDCNDTVYSADDCKYRNKSDCMAYLGDGICDFGQRFTSKGVRTGPNFACDKFKYDNGDCDCPDTMTCDGYCLDDKACEKEAYGFLRCSDWRNDNVCDYGQRTSDFGVSINFDCNITEDIADVPALNFGENGKHDKRFCSDWDWHTRYDKQTLLDNFSAECPIAVETNAPSGSPTFAPISEPTDKPTQDAVLACKKDWETCWCPTKFAQGAGDECCAEYPSYKDCKAPGIDCAQHSKDKEACVNEGVDHCIYNKKMPKGERCMARAVDECTLRKADDTWDAKACKKAGEPCFWAKTAGKPTVDTNEDGVADVGTGLCFKAQHHCNQYFNAKLCAKKAASNGHLCEWDAESFTCMEWADASCYGFKKKKDCTSFADALGCRYGKKGGKDKPKGGIFDKNKCYHWSDLCGVAGQADCEGLCPEEDKNCAASKKIKYIKTKKEKKVKFKSCAKLKKREDCQKFADKENCYWWDGDGEMKHDGDDNEGCYTATMG